MTTRKIVELSNVVESFFDKIGIKQKLNDYLSSIQNNSNNIVLTKDIAGRILGDFNTIKKSEIPIIFEKLLIEKFKERNTVFNFEFEDDLNDIILDGQNNHSSLSNKLILLITSIQSKLDSDLEEIDTLKFIAEPFLARNFEEIQNEKNSIFAIILSNLESIKDLKKFTEELKRWDRGIYIYQQLVSKTTPQPLEIIEISEGSIEIVLNIDFEIITKLFELFKTGLEVYGAYLVYKSNLFEILKSYRGNEKLVKSEEERDKMLLENVKLQIEEELKKQIIESGHKIEAMEKKFDVVISLISDQVVKGNNIKLLSAPKNSDSISYEMENSKQEMFNKNKENFAKLDETTKTKLLKQYTIKNEEKYS